MTEHFLQHRIFCNTRWRDSLGEPGLSVYVDDCSRVLDIRKNLSFELTMHNGIARIRKNFMHIKAMTIE